MSINPATPGANFNTGTLNNEWKTEFIKVANTVNGVTSNYELSVWLYQDSAFTSWVALRNGKAD